MSEATILFTGCRAARPDEPPGMSIPFNEVFTLHERLNAARGLILAYLNGPEWMRFAADEQARAFLEQAS